MLAGDDRRDTRVMALDTRGRRVAGFRTRTLRSGRFASYVSPLGSIAGPSGRAARRGRRPLPQRLGRAACERDGRADRRFGDRGLVAIADFTANAIVRDRRGRIVLAGLGRAHARVVPGRGHAADRAWAASIGRFGVVSKRLGSLRGVRLVASEARHVAIDDRGRIVIAGEAYDDDYGCATTSARATPRSPASMVDLRLVALHHAARRRTGAGAAGRPRPRLRGRRQDRVRHGRRRGRLRLGRYRRAAGAGERGLAVRHAAGDAGADGRRTPRAPDSSGRRRSARRGSRTARADADGAGAVHAHADRRGRRGHAGGGRRRASGSTARAARC